MIHSVRAQVEHREQVTPEHFLLRLEAPALAEEAQPGQFVHLRVTEGYDPLLRRPFSVMKTDAGGGLIELLIQVVGRGTQILAQAAPGQSFNLIGPLGNSFPLLEARAHVLLVAGGVGVAPLIFLAEVLANSVEEYEIVGLFGARTEARLCCWLELASRCQEFEMVTEDGSAGTRGLVTERLAQRLQALREDTVVYACGPLPMLAATAQLCQDHQVPGYVSLERWMGCGVGACLGCVVPSARSGGPRYLRVCKDGPVFSATDVDWEAMDQ